MESGVRKAAKERRAVALEANLAPCPGASSKKGFASVSDREQMLPRSLRAIEKDLGLRADTVEAVPKTRWYKVDRSRRTMHSQTRPVRTIRPILAAISLPLVICAIVLSGAVTVGARGVGAKSGPGANDYFAYVGTYTGPKSKGIYGFRFNAKTGHLTPLGLEAAVINPSWVVTDPRHRFLYAATERSESHGGGAYKENGTISSYEIDRKTGALKPLNKVSSGGRGPCYLLVDDSGKTLFVANYASGSIASFAIKPDGSLGAMISFDQNSGSSVDRLRQEGPHAHAVVLSPDSRFLIVPDLGTDKIRLYRVNIQKGTFTPNDPPFVSVKPGLGPRHFMFGPGARFGYALCEMGSTMAVFSYDRSSGSLKLIQTISTLPPDFSGEDNSAELQIDQSGRYLYASNRGHDSVAVFSIDPRKGTLTRIQIVPTQGKLPRSIALDPTGRYLVAANQMSDQMVVFEVDRKTGRLTPTGQVEPIPAPVTMVFVPVQPA
jgi:6-phosphogluconolactonase